MQAASTNVQQLTVLLDYRKTIVQADRDGSLQVEKYLRLAFLFLIKSMQKASENS
jgi:hypothetical protein